MRPFAAIVIWIVLVGGLYFYMESRDHAPVSHATPVQMVSGDYRLVLTTTFNAEKDPFDLKTESATGDAFVIKLNGLELIRSSDVFFAGKPVIFDNIAGIRVGANEFLVEASPPHGAGGMASAVRVQLFRFHEEILDRTFWADPGARIVSNFKIQIEPDLLPRNQDDH
jgi:hypothetical protein